ncbi:MAG TPA: tetratricopeptide repeat protein [Candidatus Brocadiia bacterium]|nr:tetratricopeptide repeat protein [Candidatus Brocadiia bacterium]
MSRCKEHCLCLLLIALTLAAPAAGTAQAQGAETPAQMAQRLWDRAAELSESGSVADSIAALRELVAKYPTHEQAVAAQLTVAASLVDAGKNDAAAAEYRKLIELFPHCDSADFALFQVGALSLRSGKTLEGIETLTRLAESYPDGPYAQGAREHLFNVFTTTKKDSAQAARWGDDMIARLPKGSPRGAEIELAICDLLWESKKGDDAVTRAWQGIEKYPRSSDRFRMKLAQYFETMGRNKESVSVCVEIAKSTPDSPLAYDALARAVEIASKKLTDPELADRMHAQLIALLTERPREASAWAQAHFETLIESGRTDRAREVAAEYTKRFPSLGDYFLMKLARADEQSRKNEDAIAQYERLLKEYPASQYRFQAAERIGDIYEINMAENARAVDVFIAAAREMPDNEHAPAAMRRSVRILLGLKRYEVAASVCRECLEKFPLDPYAAYTLYDLADVEEESLRDTDQAQKHFEQLLKDYPKSVLARAALYRLAQCYAKSGAREEALAAFERLADEYPTDCRAPASLMAAGKLLRGGLKKPKQAAKVFEKLREAYPASTYADEASLLLAEMEYEIPR